MATRVVFRAVNHISQGSAFDGVLKKWNGKPILVGEAVPVEHAVAGTFQDCGTDVVWRVLEPELLDDIYAVRGLRGPHPAVCRHMIEAGD